MTTAHPTSPSLDNLPKVVLVGRANVGKSTLFNRLAEKNIALTSLIAGTTRDYQETLISWNKKEFTLVDTGGFNIDKSSELEKQILNKARQAAATAEVVIMVVDAKEGLQPADWDIFREIKKTGKKTILAVNKADYPKRWPELINDFLVLGINEILPVSGINGSGSGDLLDVITDNIKIKKSKTTAQPEQKPIYLAIVGQPNVGKSSLLNAIIRSDRQIVSPQAHTTRDTQDIKFKYQNRQFILVDTAGIRRRVKKGDNLEKYSIARTYDKLKISHLTLLVLDISQPLTWQDRHLTEAIIKSGNSVIIVANKWDLVPDKTEKTINEFTKYVRHSFPYLAWAPIIFTSATQKLRTNKILDLALTVYQERWRRITDTALKNFLKKIITKHQPSRGKGVAHPYIYHIKQVDVNPPTFEVKIKYQKSLHASYLRFLEKNIRQEFKFIGTPLRMYVTSVK